MSSSPRRVAAIGALIGLGLLGALEGATRLFFESNTVFNMTIGGFRAPHPTRRTQLIPNYRSGDIEINSLGFLGPEFTLERAPGSIRILFIGNSVTFAPPARPYPRVVEEVLRAARPDQPIEAIVGAVPGYSTYEAVAWFDETLASLRPDITVIYLGWNDMGQFHPFGLRYKNEGEYRPPSAVGTAMIHVHFLRIPYFFIGRWEQARPIDLMPPTEEEQRILDGFVPIHYETNLTYLVSRSKAGGSTVFLVSLASLLTFDVQASDLEIMHFPRGLGRKLSLYQIIYEKYVSSLDAVARATTTPIIDLSELIRDPAERRIIFTDAMHVTEEGAERYARVIAKSLTPAIDSIVASRATQGDGTVR